MCGRELRIEEFILRFPSLSPSLSAPTGLEGPSVLGRLDEAFQDHDPRATVKRDAFLLKIE